MSDYRGTDLSYEESFQSIRKAYVGRMKDNADAIGYILLQRQLAPLRRDDLLRAQHMTHDLAGSASLFGYGDLADAACEVDLFLNEVIKNLSFESPMDDRFYDTLRTLLEDVRSHCLSHFKAEGQTVDMLVQMEPPPIPDVLIVDDDHEVAGLLSLTLEEKGMRVAVSPDGESALRRLDRQRPDLVILDISLPGMSGHEVLRRLKQDPVYVSLPVLMLTGRGQNDDFVNAIHCGAADYITKPFDPVPFGRKLERLLSMTPRALSRKYGYSANLKGNPAF